MDIWGKFTRTRLPFPIRIRAERNKKKEADLQKRRPVQLFPEKNFLQELFNREQNGDFWSFLGETLKVNSGSSRRAIDERSVPVRS